MNKYHVYPLSDSREHILNGLTCWCKPYVDQDTGYVIHNSNDNREFYEEFNLDDNSEVVE